MTAQLLEGEEVAGASVLAQGNAQDLTNLAMGLAWMECRCVHAWAHAHAGGGGGGDLVKPCELLWCGLWPAPYGCESACEHGSMAYGAGCSQNACAVAADACAPHAGRAACGTCWATWRLHAPASSPPKG